MHGGPVTVNAIIISETIAVRGELIGPKLRHREIASATPKVTSLLHLDETFTFYFIHSRWSDSSEILLFVLLSRYRTQRMQRYEVTFNGDNLSQNDI